MSATKTGARSPSIDSLVRRYFILALVVCGLDLAAKEAAVRILGDGLSLMPTGRFGLVLVWNTASAGGVSLGPFTYHINVLVTVVALALVMAVLRSMASLDPRAVIALGLVSGGALGNLLSMLFGPPGVADFLVLGLTADTTIVANLADLALWLGSLALIPVIVNLYTMLQAQRRDFRSPCRP